MRDLQIPQDQIFGILYRIIEEHEKNRTGKEVTNTKEASKAWLHTLATCDLFEDIHRINNMILLLKLSTHDLETFYGDKAVLGAIEKMTQVEKLLYEVANTLETRSDK